jgi:hypothetical protein
MDDYYGAKEKGARIVALTRSCIRCYSLPESSAGRGALLALHPLLEGGFRVADRAAQLDVGRAVAGEPALGQPGHAEVQVPRRLFRGQQDRRRGRPIGRRRTARAGSFGEHFMSSRLEEAPACRPCNCRISAATIFQLGERSGSVTSTKPPQAEEGFCRCFPSRRVWLRSRRFPAASPLGERIAGGKNISSR